MSKKLLGNLKNGRLFVVSAPSGTGKTTLVDRLCSEFDCVVRSVSCTSRPMRPGEREGVDYHFVTRKEFDTREKGGEFLESATVYEDKYGTLKETVDALLSEGKHVVLVIDTQGAARVQNKREVIRIFIAPPSLEELKERLLKRNTESREHLEERLSWAQKEIEKGKSYDYFIVNDDIDIAYEVLRSIFIAEENHIRRDNANK